MTDCTSLTGEATATNIRNDVELTNGFGYSEGLIDDKLKGVKTKVVFNISAVNGDSTGTGSPASTRERPQETFFNTSRGQIPLL